MLSSLPFPFPYTNSPSFLLNHTPTQRKRSSVKMHEIEEDLIEIQLSPSHRRREFEGREEECSTRLSFQWSTEVSDFIGCRGGTHHSKNHPWRKSSLTKKLKSSKAYLNLRSLFMKSACSDESNVSKIVKNESFTMKNILEREMDDHVSFTCHRKSFSGAIKMHCTSNCSSFPLKSANGYYEISLLKRSISANPEIENSIEAAIAHCKKSQLIHATSAASEVKKSCLLSASLVAACGGDNVKREISRI